MIFVIIVQPYYDLIFCCGSHKYVTFLNEGYFSSVHAPDENDGGQSNLSFHGEILMAFIQCL